jgi:hypothetical protein
MIKTIVKCWKNTNLSIAIQRGYVYTITQLTDEEAEISVVEQHYEINLLKDASDKELVETLAIARTEWHDVDEHTRELRKRAEEIAKRYDGYTGA